MRAEQPAQSATAGGGVAGGLDGLRAALGGLQPKSSSGGAAPRPNDPSESQGLADLRATLGSAKPIGGANVSHECTHPVAEPQETQCPYSNMLVLQGVLT